MDVHKIDKIMSGRTGLRRGRLNAMSKLPDPPKKLVSRIPRPNYYTESNVFSTTTVSFGDHDKTLSKSLTATYPLWVNVLASIFWVYLLITEIPIVLAFIIVCLLNYMEYIQGSVKK